MTAVGGKKKKTTRKRKSKAAGWSLSAIGIAAAAVALILVLWWVLRPSQSSPSLKDQGLELKLRSLAIDHGVTPDELEIDTEIRKIDGAFVRTWKLRFPSPASREEYIAEVSILDDEDGISVAEPVNNVGRMIGLRIDHGIEAFDLELEVQRKAQAYSSPETITVPTKPVPTATPRPAPPAGAKGRLAILLDDAGQRMDLVPAAVGLPKEIGIAILPFLPNSTETAVDMHDAGHEVWLHLPMEAVGDSNPGPGALMVGMSDQELRDAVFMAINNVPHVVGVNNHMGSKATSNLRMMSWIMQELASMDLAFLDSRTTVDTVAEEAARAQGVKTGRRHVFLDNERTEEAIRAQLDEAVYRSRMEGEIIAIGHLNEVTLAVLAEELPGLSKRGVVLARPTALLR
jgi:polysaccharide deacetylase 2 family uncharacterized protein YibQ